MRKKYQIFISSTFVDLVDERQAAVQAILRAGHIPAGMELFAAGDKSQWETIKKWIEESDIYVLILGGRYGSIDSDSKLSYTELEYRYAMDLGKPLFALVMHDEMLDSKTKTIGKEVLEFENHNSYKLFKQLVLSKVCRFFKDETEIKLAVLESLIDIQSQYNLNGWIKESELQDNTKFVSIIENLQNENAELLKKIKDTEIVNSKSSKNKNIGDYTYDEIIKVLQNNKITLPGSLSNTGEEIEMNALQIFITFKGLLATGVTHILSNDTQIFITRKLVPILLNFGLLDRMKVKKGSIEAEKFYISALGNKFLSQYEVLKNK